MKTVLITGANGNLGSAVTSHFLEKGYRVVATVIAASMKQHFTAHEHLDIRVVDLTSEPAANDLVNALIRQYLVIDAALLLVGGFTMGNIDATGSADIDQQVMLNFKTAYHVARPVYQHMKQNRMGRIVFIGARPALEAAQGKNLIAYGLSKSLLFKLAEYLNEDAKGINVTATVVAPSTLDTPLNRESMPAANPSDWVKPADLAGILEFIVSDKSGPLREPVFKVYNNT